jgi:hypothetical protein
VEWERCFEREQARYADGMARLEPEQLVRVGNAAYGAALALLMLGRDEQAAGWFERAAARWRESFEHATPASWGRPIGAIKAALLAGRDDDAAAYARWAVELGSEQADSPIGRYAATLARLVLADWEAARRLASTLRGAEGFPEPVADALGALAEPDAVGFGWALGAVLVSFERREAYLEDVPVADTVLVLAALARRRGIDAALPDSVLLPRSA